VEKLTQCPVCSGTENTELITSKDYISTDETFKITICNNCSLQYTNPRPTEENIGKYYQSDKYFSNYRKEIIELFDFNENIKIKTNENIIFQFDNPNKELKIKNIKIRSSKSNIFLNYDHNGINNDNIKIFYCNNFYFDPIIFYNFNYLNYYIEKIDLIDYL
jgi:hypothetical protein